MVRIWGPSAVEVADAAFRPARGEPLAATPPNRLRVGRIGAGLGDEVVAVVIPGDPPEVEVHCHGGPAPAALVVEALIAVGAKLAGPDDWAGHAEGPATPAALATLDLAHAATARVAEILLDQAGGALEAEARTLLGQLARGDLDLAIAGVDALVARAAVGLKLRTGWQVALAGRPNVGKSRLLNALAGFDRAIVAAQPGTTRDVVTARTAFDGWPVELADTAGLRPTLDPLEAAGVALARDRHAGADLVVLVLDRSEPLTPTDLALIEALPTALVVASKADLPPAWPASDRSALPVSAPRGDGLDALVATIARRLVAEPPPPGGGVPIRPEQVEALTAARRHLARADLEAAARSLAPLAGRAR